MSQTIPALGKAALAQGLITKDQLKLALREQNQARANGEDVPLAQIFVRHRFLTSDQCSQLLKESGVRRRPKVGRYELLKTIASGGMGVVYKAHDTGFNRTVALKVLKKEVASSPTAVARLQREAQSAAKLKHRNIVEMLDVGEDNGRHYIAMELIEGEPLDKQIESGKLPLKKKLHLMLQVARAVGYAHEHGVVHRDIKPQNILVRPDGRPVLTDFGLAKQSDVDLTLTKTGQMIGTPYYMAPEQVRGDHRVTGPASDVFSLGAVLYEIITGRRPFLGATAAQLLHQIVSGEPPSPRKLKPGIAREMDLICLRALDKDPASRYGNASELADDLAAYLEGRTVSARPPSAIRQVTRLFRTNRLAQAAAVLAIGTAVGLTVALLASGGNETTDPTGTVNAELSRKLDRLEKLVNDAQVDLYRAEASVDNMDGKLRDAAMALEILTEENPKSAKAAVLLGRTYAAFSDVLWEEKIFWKAMGAFDRAEKADPSYPVTHMERGILVARKVMFEEISLAITFGTFGWTDPRSEELRSSAPGLLKKALDRGIGEEKRKLLEAVQLEREEKIGDAIRHLDNSIAERKHEDLFAFRSALHLFESEFQECIDDANEAISRKANFLEARLVRIGAHIRFRNNDEAAKDSEYLIRVMPRNPLARFFLVWSRVLQNRWNDAITELKKAENLAGANAKTLTLAGLGWAVIEDADRAEAACRKAQMAQPDLAATQAVLSLAHWLHGDKDQAREDLREAVARRSESVVPYALLAMAIWFRTQDGPRCDELLKEAIAAEKNEPLPYVVRGQIRAEQGRLIEAMGDLNKASRLDLRWRKFIKKEIERLKRGG